MLQESQLVPYAADELPCLSGPWLVIAPHADDESIGMGGTLAKAVRAGIPCDLLVLTDGALGGSTDNLVQVRQQEVRAAAQCLGLRSVDFLNQPDRGLAPTPALVQLLAARIAATKPAAVFFPAVQEFHPDHRAATLLVWQALQLLGAMAPAAIAYEITTLSPINCLIDITDCMQAKERAVALYASQLGEQPYLVLAQALNRLRTLTLPPQVQWAEGFYRYSRDELALGPGEWAARRMAAMLAP
ncbi:MAG TPA: PIG-L deacetylase family protein [Candidatus Acidoferrum sp.]|nr:PIG-L deacetylase family protein [Candidatus Acidoferrum sp.]